MKLFTILKSRIGAVSKVGLLSAGLTVGLVGLNVYNYATDRPAAQDEQIRSLAQIISSGSPLPAEYSGIAVSAGSAQFATAQERTAQENMIFDGGDAAVGALDGLNSAQVRGQVFRGGEAGLGLGQDATEVGGGRGAGQVRAPDGSGVADAAAQKAGQTPIHKLGEAQGGLQHASMARANGTNLNTGAAGFGPSARNAARSEGASRVGPGSISGAMTGSNALVVASGKLKGATSSSYRRPSMDSHVGQGLSSEEGNSLRRIARQSGKVAANAQRSVNEGTSPFMDDTQLSGGVTVEDGSVLDTEGIGDSSFEDDLNTKSDKLNSGIADLQTEAEEREAHRKRLVKTMFLLLGTCIVAAVTIQMCMDAGDLMSKIVAFGVAAVMAAAIGFFAVDAWQFNAKYGALGEAIGFTTAALLMGGLIAGAFIHKTRALIKKVTDWIGKSVGLSLLATTGAGVLVSHATNAVTESIHAVTHYGEDSNGLHND